MPCRDYQSDYVSNGPSIKQTLDKTTRLLCTLCSKLEGHELFEHILNNNKELKNWWTNHKKEDEKEKLRLQKIKQIENAKKKALNKLTPEERKLLNLE